MTMLTSWKLDPFTVMRLNSGRRVDDHHHRQSLFIHEIVSFYMVFPGIVFKTRLKYSKELFDYNVKNTKTYIINNKSYNGSWCIKIILPMN